MERNQQRYVQTMANNPFSKKNQRAASRYLAEKDLLTPGNMYRLQDTGQGLNRVQQAPHVLSKLLQKRSKKCRF